jgi:hypothetical protein
LVHFFKTFSTDSKSTCFRIAVSVSLCTLVLVCLRTTVYSMFLRIIVSVCLCINVSVCLRSEIPVCLRHRVFVCLCADKNCLSPQCSIRQSLFALLYMSVSVSQNLYISELYSRICLSPHCSFFLSSRFRICLSALKYYNNNFFCTGRVPDPTSLFLPTSFCM